MDLFDLEQKTDRDSKDLWFFVSELKEKIDFLEKKITFFEEKK